MALLRYEGQSKKSGYQVREEKRGEKMLWSDKKVI